MLHRGIFHSSLSSHVRPHTQSIFPFLKVRSCHETPVVQIAPARVFRSESGVHDDTGVLDHGEPRNGEKAESGT